MKRKTIFQWAGAIFMMVFFANVHAQNVQDYRITIRNYRFDPLNEKMNLQFTYQNKENQEGTSHRIIQFSGRLTRGQVIVLKDKIGLLLDTYFPKYAYLEDVTPKQLDELRNLNFYRWDGVYEPAFKLDPNIGKHKFVTDKRKAEQGILLTVVAFLDADINVLADKVKSLGFGVLSITNEPDLKIKRLQARIKKPIDARAIALLPEVKYIEELSEVTLNNGTTSWVIQSNVNNSRPLWDRGILGQGQIIGHIDGLLDINNCFFIDNSDNTIRPGHRKVVGLRNTSGSSSSSDHGTFSAGNAMGEDVNNDAFSPVPNANNGSAPRARISHGNLSDLDLNAGGGTSFFNYLIQASADGAFIHTNSWDPKNTNNYTQVSADVDRFTWENENHLVIFGPDNAGPIRPGSNAKNVLVVNATQQSPNQNNFSSGVTQFTLDGRRKPDVMAPGQNITSADGGTTCGTRVTSGTSFAAPATAGGASLARQYFMDGWYPSGTKQPHHAYTPTGNLLKALMANATVDATGIAGYPGVAGTGEGWGRVLLDDGLYFDGDNRNLSVWDLRKSNGLFTGESHTFFIAVDNNDEPLKITLAWSEPPSAANTADGTAEPVGSLTINDLGLVVTAPDGTTVYNGNDINSATGLSNPNGGNQDGLNLIEQVILNNPVAGTYTITIGEGANGISQGPQGYAVVATGNFPDPPLPTGNQNTLVVLTDLPGTTPAGAPSLPNAQNLINGVNSYIDEVSYGETTINPVYASVSLTTPLGSYLSLDSNPLIEMTQDVVAQLIAGNPNVFDQGTAGTGDDIDRIMILLNDQGFTGDWATTGSWPYELPAGLTERLSVSVSSVFNDPERRLNHAMCHQLGMVDLYNHPGVVFAQPHVDNWDIMGNLNIVHPMAWSKERAQWLSTHDPNSIRWIPRPAAGGSFNETIPINWLSTVSTDNPRAIAVGLTPGVADLQNENVFYFIEARTRSIATADDLIPEDNAVLLYYVNENIQQGEGPVRIIDQNLITGTLDDAAFGTGTIPPPGGTGLDIEVLDPTGSEAYRIQIDYDPPETTNDMNIRVGDPHWTSPDIWVDSQEDGFDVESGRTPMDRGNDPQGGEDNRIYFTVYNPGPGDAFDVTVSVRVSEPYHTIGGAADFNRFVNQKFYSKIDAGDSVTDYVVWRPAEEDDEVHACIKVEIQEVFNDINDFNNSAQQNVEVAGSDTASPYEPVNYQFSVTNPYDYYQLFYFRLEGLPEGWTYTFAEGKKRLSAHERYEGSLTVTPPEDAQVCTDHTMYVTSWMPRGNTLVQYGGGTLQVNLRNRTTVTADTRLVRCDREINLARGNDFQVSDAGYTQKRKPRCFQLVTQGCTNPIRANEEIVIRYEDPDGNPVYRVVTTDEFGCYSDTYVVTEGGEWKVSATYKGDDCSGGSTTGRQPVAVPIPDPSSPGGITGIFGRNWWFSTHVGSAHPLGTLDDTADANIYAALDLTTPINDNLNLSFILGLAQMTSETNTLIEHPRYYHFSSNVEWNLFRPSGMIPYIRFGPGYYRDKNNTNSLGFNFGIGGKSRINDKLIITPGLDYHYMGIGQDTNESFLSLHLGIIFK